MKTFRRRPRDPHAHSEAIAKPEILRRRAFVVEAAKADARGAAALRELADFMDRAKAVGRALGTRRIVRQ